MASEGFQLWATVQVGDADPWLALNSEMTMEEVYDKISNEGVTLAANSVLTLNGKRIRKQALTMDKEERQIPINLGRTLWEAFEMWQTIKKEVNDNVSLTCDGEKSLQLKFNVDTRRPMKVKDLGHTMEDILYFGVQNDNKSLMDFEPSANTEICPCCGEKGCGSGNNVDGFAYDGFGSTSLVANVLMPKNGFVRPVFRMTCDISDPDIRNGNATAQLLGRIEQHERQKNFRSRFMHNGSNHQNLKQNVRQILSNQSHQNQNQNNHADSVLETFENKMMQNLDGATEEQLKENHFGEWCDKFGKCTLGDDCEVSDQEVHEMMKKMGLGHEGNTITNKSEMLGEEAMMGGSMNHSGHGMYDSGSDDNEGTTIDAATFLQVLQHAQMMNTGGQRSGPRRVFFVNNNGNNPSPMF